MIEDKHIVYAVGFMAIVFGIFMFFYSGGQPQPLFKGAPNDTFFNGINDLSMVPETLLDESIYPHPYQEHHYHEYVAPVEHGHVFTPHRYPAVSGGNMSAIMHHGWSAVMKPGKSNPAWIECPPSELRGYSI
jgi:hypothetical protein